jgi:lipoprotein-anchoring transpeptidase ErfK/SrfK
MITDDVDGQFSVNFVPTNYPRQPLPVINTIPAQKEFWRVLNASTNGFLTLQLFTDHALPLLVVSIDEQRAYVYRNGVLTGVSTASTGKKGKETPTGVFTILQKNKDHYSNIYDNAPMPYMQRLTGGGIALHAVASAAEVRPRFLGIRECPHFTSGDLRRRFLPALQRVRVRVLRVAGAARAPFPIRVP